MARKRSGISKVRSSLYKADWLLGDIQAKSKGPKATAKRAARAGLRGRPWVGRWGSCSGEELHCHRLNSSRSR